MLGTPRGAGRAGDVALGGPPCTRYAEPAPPGGPLPPPGGPRAGERPRGGALISVWVGACPLPSLSLSLAAAPCASTSNYKRSLSLSCANAPDDSPDAP